MPKCRIAALNFSDANNIRMRLDRRALLLFDGNMPKMRIYVRLNGFETPYETIGLDTLHPSRPDGGACATRPGPVNLTRGRGGGSGARLRVTLPGRTPGP